MINVSPRESFSIIWGTRRIARPQLDIYVASCIKQLRGMGIDSGDRVAICDETSVEYIVLMMALWQIKAVVAPINPHWPAKGVSAYVAKINAVHLFKGVDIKRMVCFDARQQVLPQQQQALSLDQPATIISTSGSSGEPKPALHTWGNHFYSALGSQVTIPLKPQDRWLLSLPLHHVSGVGVLVRCLLAGASVVVGTGIGIPSVMARAKVSHVSLVPTQLDKLLRDESNYSILKSLAYILLGGMAIPQPLIDRSLALGLNVYLSYGLTEMASQVATAKVNQLNMPCVKVLPYRQLRIAPDGQVMVKGEVLFKGYITGQRIHLPLDDGWFATGDLGSMDDQGGLTILGRRDHMFISGGENIHPEEIEQALLRMKGISQAVVVGKADPAFGHRPVAFIQFHGNQISDDQIKSFLFDYLPKFKIPVAFFPWPQEMIDQGIKITRQEFITRL